VKGSNGPWRFALKAGALGVMVAAALVAVLAAADTVKAGFPWKGRKKACAADACPPPPPDWEGYWFWMHSPDQGQRTVASLYNRYCVRCHAVDGRGVWDMPDIPNFADPRWQECRSDDQLVRIIIEGRGAVMPPFRGTLTLEEAWAMAHYLRTFLPGNEESRPDLGQGKGHKEARDGKKK
jgi:mono/diheme cytochrome c family protein